MNLPPLHCPAGGGALFLYGDHLVGVGRRYPVLFGVPIVVDGVSLEPASPLSGTTLQQLADALANTVKLDTLADVFSVRFRFREDWLQTEADQFIYRVADSHAGLRSCLTYSPANHASAVNEDPALHLQAQFSVGRVASGETLTMNVRVCNVGRSCVASAGANPVLLSYLWKQGDLEATEGVRTPLLVDLAPGQSISCPVIIEAPAGDGFYELSILPVHEGVRWMAEGAAVLAVTVGGQPTERAQTLRNYTQNLYSYNDDHREAARLIRLWSGTHVGSGLRIVELGGNASPMIEALDGAVRVNIDVDPYGMIIGKLRAAGHGSTVTFMVADGMRLPLAAGWADVICLFATFHHFPEPAELLKHLVSKLSPRGLICLMCEPIGHVHRDSLSAEYRRELEKGVNEQSFALWEYEQMFAAAGLDVVEHQIDVGSLKVALRRHANA